MNESISRGYLHEPYRLFHSTDKRDMDFEAHSHDFHKMVFCLNGHVTYIMEGNSYELQPWDILLIPEHQIHRSIMHAHTEYERIILWVNDSFLRSFSEEALRMPFDGNRGGLLYRPKVHKRAQLMEKLKEAERCEKAAFPGHRLMQDTYLLQFLLELSAQLSADGETPKNAVRTDPKIQEILGYINGNLREDMTVDQLAKRFFISTSHLMHTFKMHTGCSIHQYIRQKRLNFAWERIRSGEGILNAAAQAGFNDYSAFLKAFRSQYGCSPREIK
mgnify:CR=1 FL=1